jgi:hypothetical protein
VFEDNLIEEVQSHKQIRVSTTTFRELFFGCASKRKMAKLYDQGKDKITEDLDIVKIIKKIRQLETIIDCSLLKSEKTKFWVNHSIKNIIDVEDDFLIHPNLSYKYFHNRNMSVKNGEDNDMFEGGTSDRGSA